MVAVGLQLPAPRAPHPPCPRAAPARSRQTQLGWAWTDRQSYAAFKAEAAAAPAALLPAL